MHEAPQVALPDWLIAQSSMLLLQRYAHLTIVCYERAQHRLAVDARPHLAQLHHSVTCRPRRDHMPHMSPDNHTDYLTDVSFFPI